jgi:D-alanyl-lipoteichoic acid acyltransferase DltB (MBOAT superfamily)
MPLGVRFRRRHYANIVMTWIAAGLWHGVSWLFLLYGLYHGVLLATTDWLSRRFESHDDVRGVRRLARTALTIYLVLLGYVLFRARSVQGALSMFVALHASRVPSAISRDTLAKAAACLLAVVFCHLVDYCMQRWRTVLERAWIMWPAMALSVTCLALFGGTAQPFIYLAF